MRRREGAGLVLGLVVLAGCSPPPPPEKADPQADAGWTRTPAIESVQRVQGGLIFSGLAQSGARVVLRSEAAAYAASADAAGRFDIRMVTPRGHLLLRPETQSGQDAQPSPDRLLIIDGGRGPIAVLRAGGPTRRLDASPALGAIDSDGSLRLASGMSAPGGGPVEVVVGGERLSVEPDPRGRWSVVLGPASGPGVIEVGGTAFAWPGEGASGPALQIERAGAGWRAGWTGPADARQFAWLPDAATP